MKNIYGIDTTTPEFTRLDATAAECNRLARELRNADRAHRRHKTPETAAAYSDARRRWANADRRYTRLLNERSKNA